MPCVFISHSSLDREVVEREIISPLRAHGIDTWYSTDDIQTASEWERQIHKGLMKCDWFLVALSPRSVVSEWVRREAHWAVMKRKDKIVPVMLETCEPEDLHLGLLPIQYIDFRERDGRAIERLLAVWGLDKETEVKNLYRAAQDMIATGDWASAAEKLEGVLRLDPTHSQSQAGLENVRRQEYLASRYEDGVTAVREKRWREALETLRPLREAGVQYKDTDELIALAEVELEREEAERLFGEALEAAGSEELGKAVELFQAVLKIAPSHEEARSALNEVIRQKELTEFYAAGLAHQEAGRWVEALKMFRRVRAIDRGYKGIAELIADMDALLAEEGEKRAKKGAQEGGARGKAERQNQKAQKRAAEDSQSSPDEKVTGYSGTATPSHDVQKTGLTMKSRIFRELRIMAGGVGLFIVILLCLYIARGIEAYGHNRRGDDLYEQKKYADAESAYRNAMEISPENADYRNDLGNSLNAQRKYGEAEIEYRKALELRPNYAWYHNKIGTALRGQKKYAEAEAEHRRAVELTPDFDGYHNNLANVLHDQERYTEAEAEYRKAIELNPKEWLNHSNLGRTLESQKKYAEAEAEYRKAVELEPNVAESKNSLGYFLYTQGRYSEADAEYRKAIELEPNNVYHHLFLSYSLHAQNRHDEEAEESRRVLQIDPNNESAKRNLALDKR